jgi:hypothetical protein
MAITILRDIDNALLGVFMAGSGMAKNAEQVSCFIPALRKLGEKAPVFNALAERVETVVNTATPEALMDAQLLLYSLRYTQGDTDPGTPATEPRYAEQPLVDVEIPYRELRQLIADLTEANNNANPARALYEKGWHTDARFFQGLAKNAAHFRTSGSQFIRETIVPALGERIAPFIEAAFDPAGENVGWFVQYLYERHGEAFLPRLEAILAEDAEDKILNDESRGAILNIMANYPRYEATIRRFLEKDIDDGYRANWQLRCNAVQALSKLAGVAPWGQERIAFDKIFTPLGADDDYDVREAVLHAVFDHEMGRNDLDKAAVWLGSFAADGQSKVTNAVAKGVEELAGRLNEKQDDELTERLLRSLSIEGYKDNVRNTAAIAFIKLVAGWEPAHAVNALIAIVEGKSTSDMQDKAVEAFKALNITDAPLYEKGLLGLYKECNYANSSTELLNLLVPHAEQHWSTQQIADYFSERCKTTGDSGASGIRFIGLRMIIKHCSSWSGYIDTLLGFAKDDQNKNAKPAFDALLAANLEGEAYQSMLAAFAENDATRKQAYEQRIEYARNTQSHGDYIETLREFTRHKDSAVRLLALESLVEALAGEDSAQTLKLLGILAKDKDAAVRAQTFHALINKARAEGNYPQCGVVLKLFAKDKDSGLRRKVVSALAACGAKVWDGTVLAATLAAYADDNDGAVCKAAIDALASILQEKSAVSDTNATAPFEDALAAFAKNDDNWGRRRDVNRALFAVLPKTDAATARYEQRLREVAGDSDNDVRRVALDALLAYHAANPQSAVYKELLLGFTNDDDDDNSQIAFEAIVVDGALVSGDEFRSLLRDRIEAGNTTALCMLLNMGPAQWGDEYSALLIERTEQDSPALSRRVCAELARHDLAAWTAYLLEDLAKDDISTHTALRLIPSEEVCQKLIAEAERLLAAGYAALGSSGQRKLRDILMVLAFRDEEAGIRLLDRVFSEETLETFNHDHFGRILHQLTAGDNPLKHEVFANLLERASFIEKPASWFCLYIDERRLSPADFFERYRDVDDSNLARWLKDIFALGHGAIPDAAKRWDRRWARVFIDRGNWVAASSLIYDDDEDGWIALLDAAVEWVNDYIDAAIRGTTLDYNRGVYVDELLVRAFSNKHLQAAACYQRLLDTGYPKSRLDRILGQTVPGFVAP